MTSRDSQFLAKPNLPGWELFLSHKHNVITSNLLRYQLSSTMQLMNTMMIAPGGHSSLLIMDSAPHAITNDQTLHIIAHHLADVLRWLGSPHTPHWPSKSPRWSTLITPIHRQL